MPTAWAKSQRRKVAARDGDLNLPGAAVVVQFGDVKDLDAGGGFRAGGVIMDDKVHYLEASLTNRVWDRVSGNNPVNFVNLGAYRRIPESLRRERGSVGLDQQVMGLVSFRQSGREVQYPVP